jgi:putative ABC transport system permease protein
VRTPFTVAFYRRLLAAILPRRTHEETADELLLVFRDLHADATRRRGRFGAIAALLAELPGLVDLVFGYREERMLESLAQDIRFTGRSLRRSIGFTTVAVLTLALGVGANTAIFSLVNGVLLAPLPITDPDRVVMVGESSPTLPPTTINGTTPGSFYDWQRQARRVRLGGIDFEEGTITGFGEPEPMVGLRMIGGTLELIGVQPFIGRLLTTADEDPAAPQAVVLSYRTWQRLYGENRHILGSQLNVNGQPRTIVGVMPAGFRFPGVNAAYFTPARFDAAFRANRDQYFIMVLGRLTPGTSIEAARAEMETIAATLRHDWPMYNTDLRINVRPIHDMVVDGAPRRLWVLMGAVAFVLLITCANLGNLLLVRASARRREIAVRRALGAGRARIARQLVTEALALAFVGGGLGIVAGKYFLKLILSAEASTLPRSDEVTLDLRVLAFGLIVSTLAGLFFGSIPAWQLSRARSHEALREGSKSSIGRNWTRHALVVSELALAMVLLIGTGLLLRSFALLQGVRPGVVTENVLTFAVRVRDRNPSFFPQTVERIRALPGVRSAGLTSQVPITGRGIGAWFNRLDRPLPPNVKPSGEAYRVVTPEFFATMGIPLRVGRLLASSDTRETPAVVINEALAKKYYPNENPIGKQIYLGAPDNRLFDSAPIVGVVSNTRDAGLGSDPLPTVYMTLAMFPSWPQLSYVIRTTGSPAAVMSSARTIIRSLNPALPIRDVRTMEELVGEALAPARWSLLLLGIFAGIAVVIALLGVFGVLSYVVSQSTRELGIRIALGATPGAVRSLVMRRALVLVALGLTAGLFGATLLTRFMKTLLYEVSPTDPMTFVGVTAAMVAAAVLASYLPARRATRVDPVVALRAE